MIFQHARFQIWNRMQHPYSHNPDEFYYNNEALPPGVNSMGAALDYMLAVLYPQSQPAVADVGSLPAAGNTINDMRVVQDDGDGKAASYRWEQREGDAAAKWYKIYDVDWGTDSILQAWGIKTQDVYVFKYGYDDIDSDGNLLAGDLAGQHIYGGAAAGSHLTLHANAGDGVGANSGYIQFEDQVRPLTDATVDLGMFGYAFKDIWLTGTVRAGTLTMSSTSISNSSGTINFLTNSLQTSGNIIVDSNMQISGTQITSVNGTVDFADDHLTTTGDITSNKVTATGAVSAFASGTTIGTLTLSDGDIYDSSNTVLISCKLSATDDIQSGSFIKGTEFRTTNLTITDSGADSTITVAGGDLTLDVGAGNNVNISDHLIGTTGYFSGNVELVNTASLVIGNLSLSQSGIQITGGADLLLNSANGNVVTQDVIPVASTTHDIGSTTALWNDIYFVADLKNATQTLTNATLFSFRDANVGVAAGMSLFWDGAKWAPSIPDSEIAHADISGITTGDAGHTQFAMLAGRGGGQTIQGGTAASEDLTLESTSHATKGNIFFSDTLLPTTTASYSGGWSGSDIGSPSNKPRHMYMAGEFYGLRVENVNPNPASSAQNVGRIVFNTATKLAYIDDGSAFLPIGASTRYEEDLVFSGAESLKNVTVTTLNMDARKAIWSLADNTNNFERVYGKITATSATAVVVSVNTPLPAGTYRLVGVQ